VVGATSGGGEGRVVDSKSYDACQSASLQATAPTDVPGKDRAHIVLPIRLRRMWCLSNKQNGITWGNGGAGKDGEDGGVCVVESHRVHRAEARQVVLVGRVVAMPGNHIEGRGPLLGAKHPAAELVVDRKGALPVLEGSHWGEEVTWVG